VSDIRAGGCMCGGVRFEISQTPALTLACHCRGCQRLSASAYSLSEMIPVDGFRVLAGEPVIGALHGPSRYLYCPRCLNWLFTRPEGLDAFIMVRAMMLDEASDYSPFIETMTRDKLPWANTPAILSFPGFPGPNDFKDMLRAFAEQNPTRASQ
jgi:hypothetical protein